MKYIKATDIDGDVQYFYITDEQYEEHGDVYEDIVKEEDFEYATDFVAPVLDSTELIEAFKVA